MTKIYGKARVPTQDEFKRLLKTVQFGFHSKRNTVLILFSYGLGLRAIEMAALKMRDVINEDSSIKETIVLKVTKGNKTRDVFLMEDRIIKSLQEYIEWRKAFAIKKRTIFSLNNPLFLSQKGDHFTNISLQRLFTEIYKQAGFNGRSHSGRRTFATNLIENNVDIRQVQVLMGHSNISQTAQYVQDNPNRLKKAIKSALY